MTGPGGDGAGHSPATSDAPPGVVLDGVRVEYDGVTALDGVSLSVREGEFFTLVGPSGCGKTTTLRVVAGLESPDAGSVCIGGTDVTDRPPEDRRTGIVFQNYALFPHMSVRENVAYGLRFRDPPGGQSRRERVDELLALVDMAGMGGRDPTALSGGQQQRVALARALAPGPDVLLLDEPLSALDARLRERLRVTVRAVQRELGTTTVYVTHDQAEALAVSDRVAVVNEGRVEQVGTPETVYRDPASRFVAEFVGDNNLLDGAVSSEDPPRATVDGRAVALPDAAAVAVGQRVTLSVRPEAISVGPAPENGGAGVADRGAGSRGDGSGDGSGDRETTLEARVEHVEFLGEAYRVHCRWGDRSLLARAADRPTGERVALSFSAADVHVL